MTAVSPIFAIHKHAQFDRSGGGKMRSKNNTFRQVVSLEKSTFANSEKWLNQGSER
jgi:hypothetical protein